MPRPTTDPRLAALERNREPTQFKPLDPTSPTVAIPVRIPRALVDQVDAARGSESRSEWIRAAIASALEAA